MKHRKLACLLPCLALACSGGEDGADAGPQFEQPQILPERTPLCFSYALTRVNGFQTLPIRVRNEGRQQLVIESVEIQDDERGHFTFDGPDDMVVETYEDALVQVTYRPTEPGWDSAFVVFRSNAQNFPLLRVSMLARAAPETGVDGGVTTWDAGPKPPEARGGPDGGETCPEASGGE